MVTVCCIKKEEPREKLRGFFPFNDNAKSVVKSMNNQFAAINRYPLGMNSLSLQSLYLEMLCKHDGVNPKKIAHGTGFFFKATFPEASSACKNVQLKIATAGHNFSGKDFFSRGSLNKNCAEPNFVRVWLPKILEQIWVPFDIQIRDDDHCPLYRVIKHNGVDCDVAIFELKVNTGEFSEYFLPSINHQTFRESPLKAPSNWAGVEIGSQLHISGFPQQRDNQKLPVTIPAFVATEPRVDYEVTNKSWPFFLVSART